MNPFKTVELFEQAMAKYTGAPYTVAVDSCTNALFLCLKYHYDENDIKTIVLPKRTYLSVPMSVLHAGFKVQFSDISWQGIYQLYPLPVYDSAKRLTSGMYIEDSFMCLSFHIKKHLPIGKGGMILTSSKYAAKWFKMKRYEGRSEKPYHEDQIDELGWNMYMIPEQAARGLTLLQNYPKHNEDLTEEYRDLTTFNIFKDYEKDL